MQTSASRGRPSDRYGRPLAAGSLGADDQHGMLYHITDTTRRAAMGLVRTGHMMTSAGV